eukprot:6476799-Amphidinium_carterae.3
MPATGFLQSLALWPLRLHLPQNPVKGCCGCCCLQDNLLQVVVPEECGHVRAKVCADRWGGTL